MAKPDWREAARVQSRDAERAGDEALSLLTDLADSCVTCGSVQYDPALERTLSDRLDEICPRAQVRLLADELPALLAQKQERLDVLTDTSQSPEALERELEQLEAELSSSRRSSPRRARQQLRSDRDGA